MRAAGRFVAKVASLLAVLGVLGAGVPGLTQQVLEGRTLLQAKDLERRTVTLGGNVFAVALTTQLAGPDGQPIRLADLKVSAGTMGVVAVDDVDAVYYRARSGGALPVLEELRVLERLPQ